MSVCVRGRGGSLTLRRGLSGSALDDVFVVELFEKGDFTGGRAGDALILLFKKNLLESNDVARVMVLGLIYYAVGSFAQLL